MKLIDTIKDLLLAESALKKGQIYDIIDNKYICKIYYDGDDIISKGWRTVEICVYGLSKAYNPVLRAYQIDGVTDTPNEMPGWRLFRVDKIREVKYTYDLSKKDGGGIKKFTEPRPLYNPNGDDSMVKIFDQVKF